MTSFGAKALVVLVLYCITKFAGKVNKKNSGNNVT